MNEEKNNLENNNTPENLDYSFDFSNQVETPEPQVQVTQEAQPQMVDVSVPVMEETVTQTVTPEPVVTPEPAVAQEAPAAQPQMVDVSVPVMEETVTETVAQQPVAQEPVAQPESPAMQPQMADVSVPVMEETVTETVTQQEQPSETTEELKDGKSTMRFVIILGIIIVAFIIALPFVLNFLGY